MTIMLKPELSHLISQKDVLFKKDKIIISDFNYYTFLNILRIVDFDNYYRFSKYDQEKTKFAINSIIAENKKLDIFTIINYIKTISEEEFFEIGENYFEMINNYLKGSKFKIEKNKAIIYIDSEMIDLEFIFRNFDKVDVLFIYNEKNKSLNIVDRKLNILKKYKNKIKNYLKDEYIDIMICNVEIDNYISGCSAAW